jgi:hypothetical protein
MICQKSNVNGSIVSDSEFEYLKKHETDKLDKESLPWEIAFVIVTSLAVIFLISYSVYDVIHNGYTLTCICH